MEWQPISTLDHDRLDEFRLYGLFVYSGPLEWFEVHYVALDDTGQLVEPSGDSFTGWNLEDFEFWTDVPEVPKR